MSQKTTREEFTEHQKALIFARDKALCAFSGKNLRILDYGLSSTMDVDRAEHIKPATKGGTATLDNGVCASSFFNWKKQDNSMDTHYFFKEGLPTKVYYKYWGQLPDWYAKHIKRFAKLHFTDRYFNRSISRFHRGLDALYCADIYHLEYIRGANYYSKSTLVCFDKRKKYIQKEMVSSLQQREIIQGELTFDQQALFDLQYAENEELILQKMEELYPYYRESRYAMETLSSITTKQLAEEFLHRVEANSLIIEQDKKVLIENISVLF